MCTKMKYVDQTNVINRRIQFILQLLAVLSLFPFCFPDVHLAQLIPRLFLKPAVCKYPAAVNNSEIYILLPKPCP